MTNFDYISERIKAGKMNAEQMEEFIYNGTFEELDCDCPDCRKKFLELKYVPLIKSCPFCGSVNVIVRYEPRCQEYYCFCCDCGAESGKHVLQRQALESWNRREKEND